MSGGRPRKPKSLKLLEGSFRPDRANGLAPTSDSVSMPPAPEDLTRREAEAWSKLSALVDPLRVASPADIAAFRQMAIAYALIDQARAELGDGPTTYTLDTESGTVERSRPQLQTIATFQRLLSAGLGSFGMTPAAREKVSVLSEGGGADPLDEFAVK